MKITLRPITTKPLEVLIGEFAAVCYNSSGDPEKIARHVINAGHMSATRAALFFFEIEGVSRACSHQIVRHKVGVDLLQRSQRYVDEEGFTYTIPETIKRSNFFLEYLDLMEQIDTLYKDMRARDIPAEDARYILPNACHTKLNMVFNYQALFNFAQERLCTRAQWEIREVARRMVEEVQGVSPLLADHLQCKCQTLGYCPELKSCGKMPLKEEVLRAYQQATGGNDHAKTP